MSIEPSSDYSERVAVVLIIIGVVSMLGIFALDAYFAGSHAPLRDGDYSFGAERPLDSSVAGSVGAIPFLLGGSVLCGVVGALLWLRATFNAATRTTDDEGPVDSCKDRG